jgi:hypothetical protein
MEPKKFRNSFGMHFGSAKTVAARCFMRRCHWRRVGSRATADEGNKTMDQERFLLLVLFTPSVKVTVTCNKGNNAQTAVDFNFSFFAGPFSALLLCLGLLFFPSSSSGRSGGCGRNVGGRSCECRRWGKGQRWVCGRPKVGVGWEVLVDAGLC